jgi:flagellar biosynthesis/type III secretory pathway protein FliH
MIPNSRKLYPDSSKIDSSSGVQLLNYEQIFEQTINEEDFRLLRSDERVSALLKHEREEWEKEKVREVDNAFNKGYEQAKKESFAQFSAAHDQTKKHYSRLIKRMGKFWLEQKEELMQTLLFTGYEIARNIIGEVTIPEEFVVAQKKKILELLHRVEEQAKPVLSVSQSDYEDIVELIGNSGLPISVSVQPELTLSEGEFILDTDHEKWVGVRHNIVNYFQRDLEDTRL